MPNSNNRLANAQTARRKRVANMMKGAVPNYKRRNTRRNNRKNRNTRRNNRR
jgi:hypothetical protein